MRTFFRFLPSSLWGFLLICYVFFLIGDWVENEQNYADISQKSSERRLEMLPLDRLLEQKCIPFHEFNHCLQYGRHIRPNLPPHPLRNGIWEE